MSPGHKDSDFISGLIPSWIPLIKKNYWIHWSIQTLNRLLKLIELWNREPAGGRYCERDFDPGPDVSSPGHSVSNLLHNDIRQDVLP